MQQPRIVQKPPLTIVGLEASFIHALSPDTNNFKVIPPLWDRLIHRSGEVPGRIGTSTAYGVIYSLPEADRSHPHELQYIAGVQAQLPADPPPGMVLRTIPAGTFAVFLHRGSIQKIGETCREIYREWLPQSAWQHSDIADVEVYDERFDCEGEASEMEYWISVGPR
jgi:AraC family transcriptional regulator